LHPLDGESKFHEVIAPPFPFDQQSLVALIVLSAASRMRSRGSSSSAHPCRPWRHTPLRPQYRSDRNCCVLSRWPRWKRKALRYRGVPILRTHRRGVEKLSNFEADRN
jgi:hypothetical protein